jgi:Cu(I)/Ag(I) efflux system membrane fusion protein
MKRSLIVGSCAVLALALGLGGYVLGRSTAPRSAAGERGQHAAPADAAGTPVWTCSMHPQVRLDRPGDCPICQMPLIPAAAAGGAAGEATMLRLSEHALAMASVETVEVGYRPLARDLRAVGRIEYNESSLATITPRVDGFVERLFVNVTGVRIRKGDHLAEVYSPELLAAQQELLIALQSGAAGSALAEVAGTRLRLLGLTEAQVTDLVEHRRTTDRVTLLAPIDGTVIERGATQGGAFRAGDALYRIANLDSVWVYLEVYEYDLPWVRYGQRVRLSAEAIPGRVFEGMVTFVQPLVSDESRTVRIPVHIDNADQALKPGMFVSAAIEAVLTPAGRAAPTGVEGMFTCPMHPQVLREEDGSCPACEMALEQIPGGPAAAAAHDHAAPAGMEVGPASAAAGEYACPMTCEGERTYDEPGRCPVCRMRLQEVESPHAGASADVGAGTLAVPASAVLDSGMRHIVYVERSRGLFEPRELVLGPRAGEYYAVLSGIAAGERVVTRGNFLIDSQFQITGRPSLFYPGGLSAPMGHEHREAPAAPAAGHDH